MIEPEQELTEPQKRKKELSNLVNENLGKFAKVTCANVQVLNYVKLHPMHIKSIEIGWITDVVLHSEQDSNAIKQHIFKTKLKLATKAKR